MTIDEAEKRVEYFISQNQDLLTCSEEVKAYYSKKINEFLFSAPILNTGDINNLIEQYITSEITEKYRSTTKRAINDFISYLQQNNFNPLTINADVLKSYIINQYNDGKTQSLMRVNFSRLNKFYKYLETKSFIQRQANPFYDISFSEIEYTKKSTIPTEEEILTILDSLPLEIKPYFAILAVKGYSYSDFDKVSFSSAYLKATETGGKEIRVTYTFTDDDLWDYLKDETKEKNNNIIYCDDIFRNKAYYEYISSPKWYTETLNQFWIDKIGDLTIETKKILFGEPTLYFLNNAINIHAYERKVQRTIDALYKQGKLSNPYRLKDVQLYTVKQLAEQTGDLARIQAFLGFTTPNATRRFLMNNGITLERSK